jgi:putative FmdB family regulatory protein
VPTVPVYEYACAGCGDFTALRPMAAYREPQPCPGCGVPAPRVLLTAPACASMPAAERRAHAVNERSAHAPRTAVADAVGGRKKHGLGCACCAGSRGSATMLPSGEKTFPSKRPWMISH